MLSDYGKLHVSSADYTVLRPDSVDAATQSWRTALAEGRALRVRGSGHGLSGATLPRTGETLLRTRGLDHYRIKAPGLIAVGGGAILWDVRDFVLAGRGGASPSEATLRLLPQPGVADALPVGGSGRIPVSNPIDPNEADAAAPAQGADWKYWFTAFAPEDEEDAVWRTIGDWSRAHRGALRPNRGRIGPLQDGHTIGYRCLVRRKAPTSPLPPLPPENAHTKISGFPLPRE